MTRPANINPRKTITTIPPATIPRIHQIAVVLSFRAGGGTTGGLPAALDIKFSLATPFSDTRFNCGMFRSSRPKSSGLMLRAPSGYHKPEKRERHRRVLLAQGSG